MLSGITLARLHYHGGGDWYNDPDVLPNLAVFVDSTVNSTVFQASQQIVSLDDRELFEQPFIYMTGHGNVKFSGTDISNLRKYLLRGGFLYADDDYGMDKSFRREIKRLFPEYSLCELPSDHPIFNCYFKFIHGLPKIHKHNGKRPQAFAIFDKDNRMMILYTYESNISDGWASANIHHDPKKVRTTALQMGFNILYYIMSH
jgi:hypothetical protein